MNKHKKVSIKKSTPKETNDEKKSGWDEFMDILKIWM